MIKILFVCHGNICRSPMAEFIMKFLVKKAGLENNFLIESKATSTEEIGNPPHPGTLKKLAQQGIPVFPHKAVQMKKSDAEKYDFIIGMDSFNLKNIQRILGSSFNKNIFLLLDFTLRPGNIADPWYTGNFDATFNDIWEGCSCFLQKLTNGSLKAE
ncbi:MAG: low molecular weight phosphotyrosine protein phosphatase [Treponema succinifaciens]|uniref:low molecular weight protein-tyrosine-phosphatase n=1 Tax=Treponema succinifaciens TaxID=167 RepID=UPI0023530DE0|nr:low molecular weight protein-tyrosine-phosphatase [Treponema succinifaciens]MCI6912374.1 low molecular weight phosphotyrosine protein phosphatase [Treponema succinifaciens]